MDCKNEIHSDDDFDCSNNSFSDNNQNSGYSSQRQGGTNGMSKAELRKTNKPIMEKRRRARINHCLNELKSLILEAMKKDPARHTKLEKADILEMTVKHLQSVQRQQLSMAIQTDPSVIHKFKTGFVECAEEVNRYVSQLDGIDAGVRQRLTQHLSGCATSLEQIGSMSTFNNGYRGAAPANLFGVAPTAAAINPPAGLFAPTGMAQDLNNNNNNGSNQPGAPIQMGGVQLIPSRLPSGEFALIMPNSHTNPAGLLNTTASAASTAFAAWPQVANATGPMAATANQVNDFASNFKRMSAFTKPLQAPLLPQPPATVAYPGTQVPPKMPPAFHQPSNCLAQNSSTTTSPPLSPISSVSSHGDDSSMMHTSSEFGPSRPATPPQDNHLNGGQHNFSGVFSTPSSAESSLTLSLTNTSATSTSSSSAATPLSLHLQQQQVSSTSGTGSASKRSLNTTQESASADSTDSSDEPTAKRFAASKKGLDFDETERDSMWRPW